MEVAEFPDGVRPFATVEPTPPAAPSPGPGPEGTSLRPVRLDRILSDERYQCRLPEKGAKVADLVESIRARGILQPPILLHRGDHYCVLVGFRRVEAARQLKWESIDALVLERITEPDALSLGLAENLVRVGLSPWEVAVACWRLQREFGWSFAEIGARLGLGPKSIQRLLAIAERAHPFVRDSLKTGFLSSSQVLPILRLPIDEQESLARTAAARRWGRREVSRQVRARLAALRSSERARVRDVFGPPPKYARITRAPHRNGRDLHIRFQKPGELRSRLRAVLQCLEKVTHRRQVRP